MMSKKESHKTGDNVQAFIDAINSEKDPGSYFTGLDSNFKTTGVQPTLLAFETAPIYATKTTRRVQIIFLPNLPYINNFGIKRLNNLAQQCDMCLDWIDFKNQSLFFIEGGC